MLTDLRYALAQLKLGTAGKTVWQLEDCVARATDALERCIEAAERPADVQLSDAQWADIMDDKQLDAIFGDADGFTDAERDMLARMGQD